MSDLRQMIVRVDAEMQAAVKARAEAEDRTVSQTIRRAIRLYLGQCDCGLGVTDHVMGCTAAPPVPERED